jgi:hypothetical protein
LVFLVLETIEMIKTAIEKGARINLLMNNRAGGNVPLIAQVIAEKFMGKRTTCP